MLMYCHAPDEEGNNAGNQLHPYPQGTPPTHVACAIQLHGWRTVCCPPSSLIRKIHRAGGVVSEAGILHMLHGCMCVCPLMAPLRVSPPAVDADPPLCTLHLICTHLHIACGPPCCGVLFRRPIHARPATYQEATSMKMHAVKLLLFISLFFIGTSASLNLRAAVGTDLCVATSKGGCKGKTIDSTCQDNQGTCQMKKFPSKVFNYCACKKTGKQGNTEEEYFS